MLFTSRHGQELAEIRALTNELGQRAQAAQAELQSILSIQRRQLDGLDRLGAGSVEAAPLIAFVHIPKTGGGTVTDMLARAYSKAGVHSAGNFMSGPEATANKVARRPGGWETWHRRGGRVTVGHVPYGLFREHLPEHTRYMTFLREPVDRVLSHYYRHLHHPELSPAERAECRHRGRQVAGSVEEALVELRLPQLNNLATRFLCGVPSPIGELPGSALDDAEASLRDFAFVGIQERFEESMVLLQRTFGIRLLPYLNRHVSIDGGRPSVGELHDEERALIAEHNRLDAELYRFGLALFEDAAAASDESFAADVETLGALSADANREAIRTARDWVDREFPVGSTKRATALRLAAKEAGVPTPAFKQVMRFLPVEKEKDDHGMKNLTRVAEAHDRPLPSDRRGIVVMGEDGVSRIVARENAGAGR
jgi:hypothetical protein